MHEQNILFILWISKIIIFILTSNSKTVRHNYYQTKHHSNLDFNTYLLFQSSDVPDKNCDWKGISNGSNSTWPRYSKFLPIYYIDGGHQENALCKFEITYKRKTLILVDGLASIRRVDAYSKGALGTKSYVKAGRLF